MRASVATLVVALSLSPSVVVADGTSREKLATLRVHAAAVASRTPIRDAILHDMRALRLDAAARPREARTQANRKPNWIQRHPSCFGAAVGFIGGFLIGFLPGDDAVFYDFDATFNGAVIGGAGAATGAIIGWVVGRD
jgi:hypothetical protein